MTATIETLVALLVVIVVISLAARRLKTPPSILLVVTGVALALMPGLPTVRLAPDFVLLLVLPPIIYSSAVAMSWREFRFNLRPISSLATGCVLFTAYATAAAAHWLLGFSWAEGFILGALVSPPDAVAPLSIARRMQLPRRILIILEGEGLANDATALVLYRFAVAAVSAGVFSLDRAVGTFAVIVIGELVWGLIVGWAILRLRRWVGDPRIEIMLSILTPFIAYWPPQRAGGSGVLATVTAGLYISWNGSRLISAATRLQGIFFWDFLIYTIEGMVFLVTGLQARALFSGPTIYSWSTLLLSAGVVCGVVIAARFIWMFPATYLPRWLSARLARRDPSPPWQWPFALAFTGVRGMVSLAAALAIPLTTDQGLPFPHRDLILALTFSVILVTLVGQGLLLPTVIRRLGLANAGHGEHARQRMEELSACRAAVTAALGRLDTLKQEGSLPPEIERPMRERYSEWMLFVENSDSSNPRHADFARRFEAIELEMLQTEREIVDELYRSGELEDEPRRRLERAFDLREATLANRQDEADSARD